MSRPGSVAGLLARLARLERVVAELKRWRADVAEPGNPEECRRRVAVIHTLGIEAWLERVRGERVRRAGGSVK